MDHEIEQFSAASAAALEEAARRLSELALRYASVTSDMRGSTRDVHRLFDLNAELEGAVSEFNERSIDHTGTMPLHLNTADPSDDDDPFEEEDMDDVPGLDATDYLSVVSRWDVAVTDREALLRAGREAHLRDHPVDAEDDALIAVQDVGAAIRSLLGDDGRFWFNLPGIEPIQGLKAFFELVEGDEPTEVDVDTVREAINPPIGPMFYSEVW
jgi:hypothetical protein